MTPDMERRRAATWPRPHPRGWYQIADAADVRPGAVVEIEALGERWALFRGASGQLGLVHATCPHLGANLADGRVVGDCLACPFHGWAFRADGALDRIPGLDKAPRARVHSPPVRELHGLVVMWHGPVGADGEPPYEPDRWPELATDGWRRLGRWSAGELAMHPLEFCENAVDDAHFPRMHGRLMVPWTRWSVPGVRLEHEARWAPDPDCEHLAHFHDRTVLSVRGRTLRRTEVHGHGVFVGPASLVGIRVTLPDVGQVLMMHTHTPVHAEEDPLRLRVRFTWWAERSVPRWLAWYVVGSWVSQWRNDVDVWTRKAHVRRPVLTAQDGPVRELRRWFAGFYDEQTARDWLGRAGARRTA